MDIYLDRATSNGLVLIDMGGVLGGKDCETEGDEVCGAFLAPRKRRQEILAPKSCAPAF